MVRSGVSNAGSSSFPWVHLANAVLLLGLWVWSWSTFVALPGQPGGMDGGGSFQQLTFWDRLLLPLVATVITLVNYGLGPVIKRTRRINLPSSVRFTELPPEDQARIRGLALRFLQWMNAVLLVGLLLVDVNVKLAARSPSDAEPFPVVGVVYLVIVPALASILFLIQLTQTVRAAERQMKRR